MRKKLIKNTVYLYIFTITKILIPLITLPYFTRVLSIEKYGMVAYIKAYVSYIQLFLDFGFIFSATKEIVKNKENKEIIGLIVGNTFLEKIILGIISCILTIYFTNKIDIMNSNKQFVYLYVFSCILTIFIPDFFFRGIEKMEFVAIPFACSKIITLLLTFIVVKNDSQYMYIPKLEILGNSISIFISSFFFAKINVKINHSNVKSLISDLKESSIYFFSNFATTIFGVMTTLLVGIYMNNIDVAHWSICIQIISAIKALYAPIVNSIYPYMIVSKDIEMIKKISSKFLIPIVCGVLIVFWGGEKLLMIIGGVNYAYSGYILKFLAPVFGFSFYSMMMGWPVLGAIGKEKETTMSTIVAASIQVSGIIILIITSRLELIALAICCDIAEGALLLIRGYIYNRYKKQIANDK